MTDILHNIKALLFDLDGTLTDSMWMWKDIDIEYLGQYGIALPDDLQRCIEGMGFTETAVYFKERFHIPKTIEEIKDDWNQMALDTYRTKVGLKPGAGGFLAQMRERGMKMAVATSNHISLASAALEGNGIAGYFSFIRTACEVAKGKPSPDIYLSAAESLGVSPGECLVFEDVPMGILSGRSAGMKVCAVHDSWSADQTDTIRELADYYITDYRQILEGTAEVLKRDE